MKKFKKGAIFLSLFGLSFGIGFISQYKKNTDPEISDEGNNNRLTPLVTNQQKLFNNIMNVKAFDIDAKLDITMDGKYNFGLTFDGVGDISNLEDFKLDGTGIADIDGNKIPLDLSYQNSTAYFSYRDSHFRIDTNSVFEFVEALPTIYGMEVEMPEELKNLDTNSLLDTIQNMEDKKVTPSGDLCFKLQLNNIDLYIKTDPNNNFKGIRTDRFIYNGNFYHLDVNLSQQESVSFRTLELAKYQNFSPAFTIFDGFYNLTKKKQNTVKVDLDLKKDISTEEDLVKKERKDLIGLNLDLSYDFDNSKYSLDGNLTANQKQSPFNFALSEKKIYAKYSDLKVSLKMDSVSTLLDYALSKIGESKIEETINTLTEKIKSSNILEILNNADKMLGNIELKDESLDFTLDPSKAGLESIGAFKIVLQFDTNGLKSMTVTNLAIKNYFADLVLTFSEYKPFTIVEQDYAEVDPLLGLVDVYENYASWPEKKFQIDFDGQVKNDDELVKPVNMDGNIQFELNPDANVETDDSYGYGYLNVTDRNEYKHNIKADMKSSEEILFTYNDTMNGKAKIRTLKELVGVVTDIIKNPDEHFNELFGEIIEKINSMPIKQVMDGDYTQLLSTNIINRFETGQKDGTYYVEMDLALDIISFSEYGFTLRLEYTAGETEIQDTVVYNPVIKSLKVSNCKIGAENVEFNIRLDNYDEAKDITRLDPYVEYIDFSDIKVLLLLGINTSKFNYYHFNATAKLNIGSISLIDFEIPLDIKLHSKNGDIKLAINFVNIPLNGLLNSESSLNFTHVDESRTASIYYHNKMFYLNRIDNYYERSGLFFTKKVYYQTNYTRRFDLDYMSANILQILLKDVVGAKDSIMNMIENSATSDKGAQIHYEKILKDFIYNATDHYFFFDIDIAALANNDRLTALTLKVKTDNSNEQLVGLDAHLGISVGLTINVDLNLNIADRNLVADDSNRITDLEDFILAHESDALNEWLSTTHTR